MSDIAFAIFDNSTVSLAILNFSLLLLIFRSKAVEIVGRSVEKRSLELMYKRIKIIKQISFKCNKFCKVGRAIIIWGAIENSQILLSQ